MIEVLKISPVLNIWKTNFEIDRIDEMINICNEFVKKQPDIKNDAYQYSYLNMTHQEYINFDTDNVLDAVSIKAIKACNEIYNKNYNKIFVETWINIVKSKHISDQIVDDNGNLRFHDHVTLNKRQGKHIIPNYTFVCYLQMPDNLDGNYGLLFFKDKNDKIFSILPKVGEIIIMEGDVPHVPNISPNSNLDRIVLAGNILFESNKINKSLI